LAAQGLVTVTPSWTTRPPRPGETASSIEHKFVSNNDYDARAGEFLESVQLFGLPHRYGLLPVEKPHSGRIPLIILRVSLLPLLTRHYTGPVIYHIEDDLTRIQRRLGERQAQGEAQGSRLAGYQQEVTAGRLAAHRRFSNGDTLDHLVRGLEAAIREDFGRV
jgi:guanylate kinase